MARHRTQLLLDPPQYQALVDLARLQERSISEIVREFVDWGLRRAREGRQQNSRVLDQLDAQREALAARIGVIEGDPVSQVRREREKQVDEVLLQAR